MRSRYVINYRIVTLILLGCSINIFIMSYSHAKRVKFHLKMASLAPKNVGWARNIRNIMHPALDRVTNGEMRLKWYWNGVMGDDKDYIKKINAGELDGAALTSFGLLLACPEMAVLELPFLFNNYAEVDYIREKMWDTFDAIAEKNGLKLIILADQDFDQIYSVKYPMNKWKHFQQAKIIQWNGIVEQKAFDLLGINYFSMDVSSIFSAIREKLADTYIGPALWVVGSQLYPDFKYVNPIKIRYSPAGTFLSLKVWKSLPQNYRNALIKVRKNEAKEFLKQCRVDSKKAYQAMKKYGMQASKTDPATIKILKDKSLPLRNQFLGKLYSQAILNELLKHLSDFRLKETE